MDITQSSPFPFNIPFVIISFITVDLFIILLATYNTFHFLYIQVLILI
jgi:hypothetical protein